MTNKRLIFKDPLFRVIDIPLDRLNIIYRNPSSNPHNLYDIRSVRIKIQGFSHSKYDYSFIIPASSDIPEFLINYIKKHVHKNNLLFSKCRATEYD